MMLATDGLHLTIPSENPLRPFSIFSTSPEILGSPPKSSWLPTHECQFKCCQRCRPSFRERSYLSLDAVVDGELPATAITGFGFHYQKERPVALVEHVRNLGLRPNPTSKKVSFRIPYVFFTHVCDFNATSTHGFSFTDDMSSYPCYVLLTVE